MPFQLTSPAFRDGHRIPDRHTGEGEDVSPALRWSGAPDGTRSFVLSVDDPDAPNGPFGHWAVFGIPADWHELPEAFDGGDADGVRFGRNDAGGSGYSGPCPPRGHGVHHYRFRLAAIDRPTLDLDAGASVRDVEAEARRHSLDVAELVGLYDRK
ncbi:MAG: YbhB/YbcL family Raf kinase inhibitor-like protein [Bauldia sp.]